ncbi:MAG: protease pro-enzyme activation domain-containing protein, partial [Candidatus Eremiobacteraeota bacterium]|nr:protease pro-enzyme activation domain-containing protein [Candidatus Eremiobacteraeota bacterium]
MKFLRRSSFFALGLLAASTTFCFAGPSAQKIAGVPNFSRMRDLGTVPRAQSIPLAIGMRLRNERNLDALIASQSNSDSRVYQHFLTPLQLREAFGPTAADYQRTLITLRRAGFTIVRTYQFRTLVDVVAPAAVVEHYFATSLHRVELDGAETYANVAPAYLPPELRATVSGITGFTAASLYKP